MNRDPEPLAAALGVDIGGTKIAAGVFNARGRLLGDALARRPTRASESAETTLGELQLAIDAAVDQSGLEWQQIGGVGVGTTGPMDPRAGRYLEPETLPNLHGFEIGAHLSQRLGLQVAFTNDANAFVLGEARRGAGRGAQSVLGVTLGTGCGVGIVIGGCLIEGATANAGEMYRVPLFDGDFDSECSGGGLERLWLVTTGERAEGAAIAALADRGDARALAVLDAFGARLARGFGLLAALLDPEIIVLGGSVSGSYRHFEAGLRRTFGRYVAPAVAASLRFERAQLGDLAGPLGAAELARRGT